MFNWFKNRRVLLSDLNKLGWFKRSVGIDEETRVSLSEEERKEYLKHLIGWAKADIMDNKVQEWVYLVNTIKPEKMGRPEAEHRLSIVQQRIKDLEINLDAYLKYAEEHNINLND